jgi:hypothetical protein
VDVGDVGFIRNGCFHRLIDVFLPRGHPPHRIFGVPGCHQLLRLSTPTFIHSDIENTMDFRSTLANCPMSVM